MGIETFRKQTQEEISKTILDKLSSVMDDPEISGPEFASLRQEVDSISTLFKNEFIPGGYTNNKILLEMAGKLTALASNFKELEESKFDNLRGKIRLITEIIHNDLLV